jgi:hypothetical protein
VALRLAGLALVPDKEHDSFCYLLCGTVQRVWSRARRAKPGPALVRAAEATRTLHEALGSLNKEDRDWVEGLLAQHPATDTDGWLPETVSLLANLFSSAVGNSPPPDHPGGGARPDQKGRRRGTVKNVIFQDFVSDLLTNAGATGGDFTFDKNYEMGTVLEAIRILTPHLPEGVCPKKLPMGTIQRIVTRYRKVLPDIEIDLSTK